MSSDSLSAIKSKVETKSIKLMGPKIATSICSVEIDKNKFIKTTTSKGVTIIKKIK